MTITNQNLPTATTPIQVNQDELSNQSPPKTVVLSDGRVLHLWTDYADHDHTSQMQLQGRIYNANGTPSTGQFELNSWRIDGFDGFDVDNLDVDVLTNGNVVIGYVRATDAVTHDYDEPVATIINPSITPGGNGFVVAQNIVIQQNDTTTYESPPVIEALADGRFIAVWSKNGAWDDTTEQPVMARIFNANGTPSTNEFVVGSWDVDGSDGYDMDNLTVTQLAGGNIVVSFLRSYRENGGDEPVFAVLDSNGVAVRVDQEMQQNDTTTWESPPVVTALADGRFMAVWYKNGLHDNDNNMTIQGRIFNADGTPSTGEFRVGTLPADGFDAYDTDNLVMTQLSNGNVVVGFVNNTSVDHRDYPHFSVINPSINPGGAGFAVISDVQINNDSNSVYYAGPPVIQALANGNFVAVWVDGNVGEHSLPIKAKIYDGNGNALSSEFLIVNRGDQGISTFDGFDWDNLNVVVQPDGKFVVSWVGQNDGSGTSVMTSGPIDPANFGVGSNIPNNLIVNGSFENVTGLTTTGYGFVGNGSIPSWTSANGSQIDIHNDKRGGINPADGNNWLDLEASPGNVRVGQNVQGVVSGNNYTLTFSAGDIANSDDGTSNDNTVTVYWGGQAIATINPNDGSMSQYQFNLVGGAGNGNNRLEFEGGGRLDNLGVSIDKVSLVANGSTPINNTGLIYYSDSNGNVGTLNPTTGANNVIGNSGKIFLDVAQNSAGQLFGVTNEGGTAKLYSINTSTGVASFLYNINNTFINSLTGDNANNLYAVSGNGALLRISANGAVTTLGNIGSSEGDLLVIGNNVYLSRADNVLVKYDLTTNQVSNVANLPEGIFGLAQNPNGNIYAIASDGKVYDVNPSTGSVTFTGADVNISGQVNGASSAQAIIPTTLAPDMTPETDTGVSNTDNITSDNTPSFLVTNPNDLPVNLYVNGVKVPSTYDPVTNIVTPTNPISDGSANVTYTLGNSSSGPVPGVNASALNLSLTNFDNSTNTYRNIATTTDGRTVMGKLVLLNSPSTGVNTKYTEDHEILLNGENDSTDGGKQAQFRLEFYDQATGQPISISSVATFGDLDKTATAEMVTVNKAEYSSYSVAGNSSLSVDTSNPNQITAKGTQENDPTDNDAKISLGFQDRQSILFTLTTRDVNSGFTITGSSISNPVTTSLTTETAQSPALPIVIDTQAPTQPATAPDMTAATDTGPSNTDNNTDDSTPDFAVTVPVGTTPSLYVDGVKVPAIFNPATGTLTPSNPIANGPHNVAYTLTDPAGNESAPSPALPVIIGSQSVAPATPTVAADMTAPSDTGASNTDNITKDNTPSFVVDNPSDLPVTLYINGTPVASTYDPATNTVTPTNPIPDGSPDVTYALGTAPNLSGQSPALPVAIDTQPPAAPTTTPDMTAATDTGPSNTDNNTDDSTPDFAVTVPVGTTPSLYVDGVKVPAIFNPATGTLTPSNPIANGPHNVAYTLTDPAGNESAPSPALPVIIGSQSVAPATPTVQPDMTAPTDTGASNTDNNTSDSTPDFAIPSPGSNTPNLYVDGVKVPSTYNPTTGTLTPNNPISEGPHNLQYSLTNPQGQESGLSPALPILIDTQAPAQPSGAPDMTAATDTGPSNTDNNTDDSTPDFAVTVPVGTTPSLYVDGVKVPAIYNPATGTLTPSNPIANGPHTVAYSLTDPAGNESAPSPALPIVIGAQIVNRDPNAVDDNITGTANTQVVIAPSTLLSNDSDVDGDTITGVSIQNAQNGQVFFDGTNVIFVPNTGYTGPASFTYTITDGKGAFDTATVNLNIAAPANTAPDARDDIVTGTANTQVVIAPSTLLSNDSDVDGDTITGVSIQNAQNGQVFFDGTNVIFVPNTGYTGPASFTYTITDGKGAFDTATVNLNIAAPANTAPDARDDVASGVRNTPIVISPSSLLANDVDANGDTLTPISVQGAVNGVVSFDGTNIIFTPNTGYTGPASFTYTISDGKGGTDTATVNLTVAPPANTAPDARDDVASGVRNTPIVISPSSLLANDVDADGDTLTPISVQGAVNGVVSFDGTNIIFTPNTGYTGPASFTYTISDGKGGTDTATVNLTVAPPANTAPDARDDVATGIRDTNIVISPSSLLANDVDVDGDTLTPINLQNAVNGQVYFDGVNVIFVPNTGYTGPASFTYTISDGKGGTDTATVNLTIAPPPNTAPDARDDVGSGTRNTNIVISPASLLANDVDADGDTLTPINVGGAVNGVVTFDGTNIIFTPNTGYTGPASFTYTVSDGKGGTDTATVNLTVAPPANTAPDARDDSGIFGFRDTNLTIAPSTLLANDVDADGDTITPINLQDAVNGQVFFDGVNVIFVPNSGYTGPASFTYTVSDGKGGTDTATVNLNIGSKIIGTENDFLEGTSGNDFIDGLSGDDVLIGNAGNDILIGGKGSDTMTGGTGNDVFTFKLGDASASEVEIDTIKDFQVGDVLNLKDLLQGESSNAASLDNYLHFNFENNSTVISVSTNGQANAGVVDQKIVLENVDLTAGNTLTDLQVIQNLLSNNAISTD